MKKLLNPATLFGRTALSLSAAFLVFAIISYALLQYMLVQPQTRQAANDLAALLVLAGQIWVELPPATRKDYETELLKKHKIKVLRVEALHPMQSSSAPYINFLEEAMTKRINQSVPIHTHPDHEGWLWVDFPMGGQIMRLGFQENRLINPILIILPALTASGLLLVFIVSIILVRRVAQPLERMAEATDRIAEGDFTLQLPETGPTEISGLARKINLMQAQISQLLENRTTLLAGISHDLRTPLSRMQLELEMLSDDKNDELIQGLRNDLAEIENLISQTLALAKDLKATETSPVDINELLLSLVEDFRRSGSTVHFAPKHACLRHVREDALKRVLTNVINNAIAYSDGLPVNLECTCDGPDTTLKVIDHGPGIPPAEHKAVFQPFYRLESSRSKATGGSGLGLAIVHQLCRANGWNTEILPTTTGGTIFQIQLPFPGDQD